MVERFFNKTVIILICLSLASCGKGDKKVNRDEAILQQTGRYQIVTEQEGALIWILDTSTGKIWHKAYGQEWHYCDLPKVQKFSESVIRKAIQSEGVDVLGESLKGTQTELSETISIMPEEELMKLMVERMLKLQKEKSKTEKPATKKSAK